MDITPKANSNQNFINSYGPDGFKINEILYKNSVILTPYQIIEVKINSVEDFFEQELKTIINLEPEIFLIGTGKKHIIIPVNLKNKIKQQYSSVSVDEMSTGSACRTYNILMTENRNVVTILMPII
jgi:uncharacterized protein